MPAASTHHRHDDHRTETSEWSAQPSALVKFHVPEVVVGVGSLGEAGYAARRLGARHPMVVTDPGIIEAGWVAELLGHLGDVGLHPVLWSGVTPNPKDHEITAAYELYRANDCDVIIAIGGGSCLDAAKGVAILSGGIATLAGVEAIGAKRDFDAAGVRGDAWSPAQRYEDASQVFWVSAGIAVAAGTGSWLLFRSSHHQVTVVPAVDPRSGSAGLSLQGRL